MFFFFFSSSSAFVGWNSYVHSCFCTSGILRVWPFLPRHLGSHTPISEEACWVFSCFYNPPNSDIVYRIFSVRTWVLCLRVHTKGDKPLAGLHISWPGSLEKSPHLTHQATAAGILTLNLPIKRPTSYHPATAPVFFLWFFKNVIFDGSV